MRLFVLIIDLCTHLPPPPTGTPPSRRRRVLLFDASQSVPPFAVIPERSDYLKLYAVIGVMLLTAFVVLGRLIKKIKISQALKLGED